MYNAPSNIIIKGKHQSYNFEIPIDVTGVSFSGQYIYPGTTEPVTLEYQDAFPNPKVFSMVNNQLGNNYIAYYFQDIELAAGADTATKIAIISSKLHTRNVVYAAID